MCDWDSSKALELEGATACNRWSGECTFGCERCRGDMIAMWTLLGIFVFFPVIIGLGYLIFSLALRCQAKRAADVEAPKDPEGQAKEELTSPTPTSKAKPEAKATKELSASSISESDESESQSESEPTDEN